MSVLNSFLSKLQMEETRKLNIEKTAEANSGVILPLASSVESGNEAVEIGYETAAVGQTEVLEGQKMFSEYLDSFFETGQTWSWAWKAARKREDNHPSIAIRATVSGVAVGVALLQTFLGSEIPTLIQYFMTASAVSLVCDPLDIAGRVIAFASRVMIGIDIFLWIGVMNADNENFTIAVLLGTLIILSIIAMGNKFWLKSENWLMTDSVEHALTIDPENEASKAWHGDGRRSARTLLHQIGHDVSEADLDGMIKPIFSLGYWMEYERKTSMQDQIEELSVELKEAENYAAELEQHIESIQQKEAELDGILKEKNELKKELENVKGAYDLMINRYQKLLEEKTEVIQSLEEELRAEKPEIPEDRNELIRFVVQRRAEGKSYQKIADEIGRSKSYVINLAKEGQAIPDEGKVVNMFQAVNG